MILKENLLIIIFFIALNARSQTLQNTSYINQSGEKVLRLEITVPLNVESAWKLFTTDNKLEKWAAPLAHIDLKSGGYLVTNYDTTKQLSDSSSIRLPVKTYIDNELIIFQVILNSQFAQSARNSDENLQEVIQFQKIDNQRTKIISSMIGWGAGADWDKTYNFFTKGNEWTYNELLKHYQ